MHTFSDIFCAVPLLQLLGSPLLTGSLHKQSLFLGHLCELPITIWEEGQTLFPQEVLIEFFCCYIVFLHAQTRRCVIII